MTTLYNTQADMSTGVYTRFHPGLGQILVDKCLTPTSYQGYPDLPVPVCVLACYF